MLFRETILTTYVQLDFLGVNLSAEGLAHSPSRDIGSEETLVATEDDSNSCGVCTYIFL